LPGLDRSTADPIIHRERIAG